MRPVSPLPGCYVFPLPGRAFFACALLLIFSAALVHAQPVLPPTQSVPTGVRPLRGPPVVSSVGAFEVDAMDYPSAQAVINLAQHLRTIISKDLLWPDLPPGAIQVQLVPAASADFAGAFVITVDADGHRTARVRWGPDTALADVCLALSRVTLESMAAAHSTSAAQQAPEWLKLAYGKMLEAETKPAIIDEFSAHARQQPILSLRQIMTAQNPAADDLPLLELNAYWLAHFLEIRCGTSANTQQLFSALAAGADPAAALDTAFPGQFADARDLELWWEVGCRDLTNQHLSPVFSLTQSRALLDRLEFVDLPRSNAGTERTRLDAIWASRADKTIQQNLATIILNAAPLPLQVNPVYKNALLSLLHAMTLLSGNDEKAFQAAWVQYQSDRTDAERIESSVEKALSEAP